MVFKLITEMLLIALQNPTDITSVIKYHGQAFAFNAKDLKTYLYEGMTSYRIAYRTVNGIKEGAEDIKDSTLIDVRGMATLLRDELRTPSFQKKLGGTLIAASEGTSKRNGMINSFYFRVVFNGKVYEFSTHISKIGDKTNKDYSIWAEYQPIDGISESVPEFDKLIKKYCH